MNRDEALAILRSELGKYRSRTYTQLRELVGASTCAFQVIGPSGAEYQIEIDVMWDSKRDGDIRVFGSVDDGGWRAFVPLIDSFIKAPDGSFVGED